MEITNEELKSRAAAYLETMPRAVEVAKVMALSEEGRALVILAMVGFACDVLLEELSELGAAE